MRPPQRRHRAGLRSKVEERRATDQARVLAVLASEPVVDWGAFDLADRTNLKVHRVLPALEALMRDGRVEDDWLETVTPKRRVYRLRAEGSG